MKALYAVHAKRDVFLTFYFIASTSLVNPDLGHVKICDIYEPTVSDRIHEKIYNAICLFWNWWRSLKGE